MGASVLSLATFGFINEVLSSVDGGGVLMGDISHSMDCMETLLREVLVLVTGELVVRVLSELGLPVLSMLFSITEFVRV